MHATLLVSPRTRAMTDANFNRPPRQPMPSLPITPIDIPAPPTPSPPPNTNWLISVLPVIGIGVLAVFYVWRAAAVRGSSALFAIPLFVLAVFAIIGSVMANRWRKRDHERSQRETMLTYLRTLEKKRARLQAAHIAQRGILAATFPHAASGLDRALARDPHLWERRPDDDDFMALRVGVGDIPSPVMLSAPDPDTDSPELARALALADTYRTLHDAPVVVPLLEHFAVGVSGRRDLMMAAVRAMLCHIALAHAPQDVRVFVVSAAPDDWRWARWLPHADGTLAFDAVAARVLLGALSQTIDTRRESGIKQPHLLVIFDNPQLAASESVYSALLGDGEAFGASALCLTPRYEDVPGACSAVVEIYNNGAFKLHHAGHPDGIPGHAVDTLPLTDAEHIGRGLASVTVREAGVSGRIPRRVGFLDLYGLRGTDDLRALVRRLWARGVPDGILPHPVPIGRESLTTNTALLLDEDHHGPHGVLAGTTGSGKSELLQTLVCALAVEHHPQQANFLLIDFKGGSTFNAFARLPHTVGMVTNLDGALVERALAALRAEVTYRQQFLKSMGVRDITQYYRHFAPLPQPLPHLFIIVDEFAQLAREMPDFLGELVRIAQVGRSLGLHLILGTQSPMDVITEEMNANLQFRICLRVQNAEASRAMLRRPDAAYLPAGLAGRGYFMVGERGVYKQFQTAYAGGDYRADHTEPLTLERVLDDGTTVNLLGDENGDIDVVRATHESPQQNPPQQNTAAAVIDAIAGYVRESDIPYMPPLLLPPLDDRITLEEPFIMTDFGGWNGRRWGEPGFDHRGRVIATGSAPVGVVDDVYTREQTPLWVHLNDDGERGGHLMIVGGPGSGKTTLLNTLAVSLALLHPPDALHLYLLSFTGGGLNHLGYLPHAERVVHGTETERVRRLFGRLIGALNTRQTSRARVHSPTIVLMIDQYEQLRDTFYEQHIPDFARLVHEGRGVGIYVVFTASTASAVPDRIRSLVQQRIALRLASASDYLTIVGQVNADHALPAGRGYVAGSPPLACQVSLPVFGGAVDIEKALRKLVNDMRQGAARRGRMQSPDPIAELPDVLLFETLPRIEAAAGLCTVLGQVDNDDLSDFVLDWDESGPHFVVTGPPGSGKTNVLHAAVLAAALHYPPERLRFLLLDFGGRSLRALAALKHVVAHVTDPTELEMHLKHLQNDMDSASVGAHAPAPRTVIVIDDYEIAADVMSMNLDTVRQLRDHARLHADAGLHIWAAGYLERVGDPLMKQLLLRRTGFALQERDALHNLNVRAAKRPADVMPPGRAFFARHNDVRVVQTALIEDTARLVAHLNADVWGSCGAAAWRSAAKSPLPADSDHGTNGGALDIDTAGLIEDLLGGGDA